MLASSPEPKEPELPLTQPIDITDYLPDPADEPTG